MSGIASGLASQALGPVSQSLMEGINSTLLLPPQGQAEFSESGEESTPEHTSGYSTPEIILSPLQNAVPENFNLAPLAPAQEAMTKLENPHDSTPETIRPPLQRQNAVPEIINLGPVASAQEAMKKLEKPRKKKTHHNLRPILPKPVKTETRESQTSFKPAKAEAEVKKQDSSITVLETVKQDPRNKVANSLKRRRADILKHSYETPISVKRFKTPHTVVFQFRIAM
jgi:hypothetical protein